MEKKKVNGVIVLLIIIIMILTMFCALFATGVISLNLNNTSDIQAQSKNNEIANTTLNDVQSNITTTETVNGLINQTTEIASKSEKLPVGCYYAELPIPSTAEVVKVEPDVTWGFELNLYEDGVFIYSHFFGGVIRVLGNYYKEGNKIVLNTWYNGGSSVDLRPASGKKTLTINEDGSITDDNIKNKSLLEDGVTSIKMNLDTDRMKNGFDNGFRMELLAVYREFYQNQTIKLEESSL